jgi:hypothetical protein
MQLKTVTGRLYDAEVEATTLQHGGSRVIDGPFRGMSYIDRSNCSALTPKLLGSYEREVRPFVEDIISKRHSHIIDIGCAEGYYAVGMALRMPETVIHAYDIDESALRNLQALAALNGVTDRISAHSHCSLETLESFGRRSFAVICDIEGGERQLLNPAAVPALAECDILVEIHDGRGSAAIHDALRDRFSKTHRLTFVQYEGRSPADAAHAGWLGHSRNRMRAVDEHRTFGLEWGYFAVK